MTTSPFFQARLSYTPQEPRGLENPRTLAVIRDDRLEPDVDDEQKRELRALFPKSYGSPLLRLGPKGAPITPMLDATAAADKTPGLKAAVVFSGGPAPGGHNVIWGLCDGLRCLDPGARLIGFRDGPGGILSGHITDVTPELIGRYRNAGGFDLLGSGRLKIDTPEQFAQCRAMLERHQVDTLVIVGGDDSNTNAAFLAEYFLQKGSAVRVLGVPKTIDGDLKNRFVETSFGFDTASRTYAELVSNIALDALSSKKHYHFVRLMGRSASHITLETALQTRPNLALIAEEVAAKRQTLRALVAEIGDLIKRRAAIGKNFGVILVPEGVVEFIPEIKALIDELNHILGVNAAYVANLSGFTAQSEFVSRKLSKDASYTFAALPIAIQRQLLMERDPHGNVIVSSIETEKLLTEMLAGWLGEEKAAGRFNGTFRWQHHFLGYEGRCGAPTNFDADYAYALGKTAAALVGAGVTGYMSVVAGLTLPHRQWQPLGVPMVSMMNLETRHGRRQPVIKKALVALNDKPFVRFAALRANWELDECYRFAGPIQYFGPSQLTDSVPCSLSLAHENEAPVPEAPVPD